MLSNHFRKRDELVSFLGCLRLVSLRNWLDKGKKENVSDINVKVWGAHAPSRAVFGALAEDLRRATTRCSESPELAREGACAPQEVKQLSRREASYLIAATAAGLCVPKFTSSARAAPEKELPMILRAIPSSGEKLPVIGLGTWRVFDVNASPNERAPVEEVLVLFVQEGAV